MHLEKVPRVRCPLKRTTEECYTCAQSLGCRKAHLSARPEWRRGRQPFGGNSRGRVGRHALWPVEYVFGINERLNTSQRRNIGPEIVVEVAQLARGLNKHTSKLQKPKEDQHCEPNSYRIFQIENQASQYVETTHSCPHKSRE